ncbi:hypothetical protein I5M27_14970 [Adhaeribacter sp. BT258]|uniref:CYTH domain-containing protein n=1 Tax=Adhaeribacter terrigena TaxID=2793070 RepID=A0ABS1C4K9_9BACT|nr:hypothetical protein [Adhaeribacter terrigena]MBK0404297.1 hypothetical protein [Adhaeribacter terrigena]
MLQSYKTIKRAALSQIIRKRILVAGLLLFMAMAALGLQVTGSKRGTQFFVHFTYRFLVPEKQTKTLWRFLEKNYATALPPEEDTVTDFYFDDDKQTLLRQNMMLRRRLIISREGRKDRTECIFPGNGPAPNGQLVVFRHNRKPDKGTGFTTHPLLKLIRKKDRPVLDSLLKPLRINPETLKPVLEITQHRKQLHLQKNNSAWISVSLAQLRSETPAYTAWELQIIPDRKFLTHASADVKKELLQDCKQLAATLKKQFPELQPQTQTELLTMLQADLKAAAKEIPGELGYPLGLLALAGILFWFFNHFKQKRRE